MEMTGLGAGSCCARSDSHPGWLQKGEDALVAKKPVEATECFDMALRDDPFDAKAHCALSRAYWEQGKTEDALNSLTRALELDPNDRQTVLQCSRIFSALGKRDFAEDVIKSYIDRNPQDDKLRFEAESVAGAAGSLQTSSESGETAEFFRKQGIIQFERGNQDYAKACFEMAIQENPDMAEAHNDLGVIHLQSGSLEAALQNFLRALELDPEDPEILGNSARALSMAGQIDTAVDLFREYLKRCPQDDEAWEEYETLVRRSALPQWDKDSVPPETAEIYLEAARKLMEAGDFSGAAEAVERAVKIRPGTTEAIFVLASLHNAIGQKAEAEAILEEALVIDPSCLKCAALLKSISNGDANNGQAALSRPTAG